MLVTSCTFRTKAIEVVETECLLLLSTIKVIDKMDDKIAQFTGERYRYAAGFIRDVVLNSPYL